MCILRDKKDAHVDNDYIHANFVDGYMQRNAYILTQVPLKETLLDYWLMIWQNCVQVIVMTSKFEFKTETHYWPMTPGETMHISDAVSVKNLKTENSFQGYRLSCLLLTNLDVSFNLGLICCYLCIL